VPPANKDVQAFTLIENMPLNVVDFLLPLLLFRKEQPRSYFYFTVRFLSRNVNVQNMEFP